MVEAMRVLVLKAVHALYSLFTTTGQRATPGRLLQM